jgi:hypothetical protein
MNNTSLGKTAPAPGWLVRWLWPTAIVLTLAGYFGPWVNHAAAGLVIMGLDLAEYVKFLPAVRSGELALWREGFYLPLVAVSLACSFAAFRPEFRYPWTMRALLLVVAAIAALNLLPPAWTPGLLWTPEFRTQTVILLACLGLVLFSPFVALLPVTVAYGVVTVVALAGIWFPVSQFLAVLPGIRELYRAALQPGWGMYCTTLGLTILAAAGWVDWFKGERSTVET